MQQQKQFAAQGRIEVAFDERELADKLDQLDILNRGERLGGEASPPQLIIRTIRTFIETGHARSEVQQRFSLSGSPAEEVMVDATFDLRRARCREDDHRLIVSSASVYGMAEEEFRSPSGTVRTR